MMKTLEGTGYFTKGFLANPVNPADPVWAKVSNYFRLVDYFIVAPEFHQGFPGRRRKGCFERWGIFRMAVCRRHEGCYLQSVTLIINIQII